jgi:flagellar hook-associated protein 2
MSLNSINGLSSRLRLTGMASGLDTDSIVNDLMRIEQLKVDKVYRQKVLAEWRREAVTNVRNKLRTFRDTYSSALSSLNMNTSSVYKKFNVEMAANPYVKITANSSAREGTYRIDKITRLAETAKLSANLSVDSIPGMYATLESVEGLEFHEEPMDPENGEEVRKTLSFTINDETFTFESTDTIKHMLDTVNRSDAGVNMHFSELTMSLHIETKNTGEDAVIDFKNVEGSLFGLGDAVVNGEDAFVTINGVDVKKSSNSFTIDGITYNLTGKTNAPVDFVVSRDVQHTVDKIKEFVQKYNELVEELNGLLSEKKNYDFAPLTEAQKKEMEAKDIEEWEAKAKSGLLKNDPALSKLVNSLRSSIYQKVEGIGLTLSDIGITTGSYLEKGKLHVDETKLAKYIKERPDDVMNLFMQSSPSGAELSTSEKYAQSGFFARMTSTFNTYYDSLQIDRMDRGIREYEDKISDLEIKLYEIQERYYRQFARLEAALSNMYSQQSWLYAQFNQGQ